MKKFKRAFTLAEILVALGIVGVVSAIAIPLVSANIQKQQSGAVAGRVVEQIEVGSQNMIQYGNETRTDGSLVDVLSVLDMKDMRGRTQEEAQLEKDGLEEADPVLLMPNFYGLIRGYWGVENDNSGIRPAIKNYLGAANNEDSARISQGTRFKFKKFKASISIILDGNQGLVANNSSEPDTWTGYSIFVDTNGWDTAPNMTGKDIFVFDLLNNGSMRPTSRQVSDAEVRTTRLVRDGFKIKY